jgi:nitroimidazol reductase NimA-like FMN-containing flavoprotein (pyridoxamine 5'-phosphate oxidase superfamily)
MTIHDDHRTGSLIDLSNDECRALLGTTTVGRLAFVNNDGQQLIPANFALIDGDLYFRTAPDGVLAGLAKGHQDVAFGVDHHADVYRNGWNVTVRGTATRVKDRGTIDLVMGHRKLRPWAEELRPLVIQVTPSSIAGRRVRGR